MNSYKFQICCFISVGNYFELNLQLIPFYWVIIPNSAVSSKYVILMQIIIVIKRIFHVNSLHFWILNKLWDIVSATTFIHFIFIIVKMWYFHLYKLDLGVNPLLYNLPIKYCKKLIQFAHFFNRTYDIYCSKFLEQNSY